METMERQADGASKVIVITGAGRGIGAAVAYMAADRGYGVCVNYRSNDIKAKAVAGDINAAGGKAIAVQADVGNEADVIRLFKEVDSAFGRLDALVNNAGISGGHSPVAEITSAVLNDVFAVNVFGAFLCAREAIRRMSTKHGGHGGAIVNVSSQAADFGGNKLAHYAASKAALNAFTLGFAREAAPQGVRVNAVSPGIIATDQFADASHEQMKRHISGIPLGRPGTPEEVAATIMWLLTDAASFINGAIIPVTGGR